MSGVGGRQPSRLSHREEQTQEQEDSRLLNGGNSSCGSISSHTRKSSSNTNAARRKALLEQQNNLAVLMYFRKWDKLFDIMTSHTIESTANFGGESGVNMMHLMCRFQPPLELMELVHEKWPWLVSEVNPQGHLPLHVAALYGSKSNVVKFLLEMYGDAATMADRKGRTPLHLACRPLRWHPDLSVEDLLESCTLDEEHENELQSSGDVFIHAGSAVIDALCKHAPKTTNEEDVYGCNPLEIAIAHGLSKKICQILLDTSDQAWKAYLEEKRSARSQDIFETSPVLTLPGYSESATKEFLKKCRNSSDCSLALEELDLEDDRTVGTATTVSLSMSLPPYNQMLEMYQSFQQQHADTRRQCAQASPLPPKTIGGPANKSSATKDYSPILEEGSASCSLPSIRTLTKSSRSKRKEKKLAAMKMEQGAAPLESKTCSDSSGGDKPTAEAPATKKSSRSHHRRTRGNKQVLQAPQIALSRAA